MSSIGFSRSGAGVVPVLQRAWTMAVESTLQAHDDKLDVLRDVVIGTAQGVEAATTAAAERLRRPLLVACGALVATAVFTGGLLVVQILSLFRPISEVIR